MSDLFSNYKRLKVAFRSGKGCRLFDQDGTEFLDFLGGIAVTSLGHSHPKLVQALTDQVQKLLHVSNLYEIAEQEQAAASLVELCGGQSLNKVFFCNSGAEANECLLKIARKNAWQKGLPSDVLVAHNGFHGRTLATVSATGTAKYHEGFAPLMPGFRFVEYNDVQGALAVLPLCGAVLIEPIQGEGGVVPATHEFLSALRQGCTEQGKLLLFDEVQTGIGRTGHWLAAHHYGVVPDALSLAKGLGGGIPVGAVLAGPELAELLGPGSHGTTFGGNPLASRAVETVLRVIQEEGLLAEVQAKGAYLQQRLAELPGITEVRGLGLMVAAVTEGSAEELAAELFDKRLLVNAVRPQVLRFVPPLVVTLEEIDQAVAILSESLCLRNLTKKVEPEPSIA